MTDTATTDTAPLSIDEIVHLALPADAQISPNGAHVAYTLAEIAKDGAVRHAHLWLVPSDGSAPPTEITGGPREDKNPRWSPDSTQIAFISDRAKEGESGIYLLSPTGGEARRLGTLGDGGGAITALAWSPDGSSLLAARTEPDSDDLKKRKEAKDDAYLYDNHRKYTCLWRVDATTGEASRLGPNTLNVWAANGLGISPDGTRLAFVGSDKPGWSEGFGGTKLYTLTLADGTVSEIAGGFASSGSPAWSPDGSTLAFLARPERAHQGATQLHIATLSTGAVEMRLADIETGRLDVQYLPDGNVLLANLHGTALQLARYDAKNDELSPPLPLFAGAGSGPRMATEMFSLSRDASRIALVRGDLRNQPEVWAGPLTGPLTCLSHHGGAVAARVRTHSRVVTWTGADGREIAGILITPDAAQHGPGPYPFVVQVHGGPAGVYAELLNYGWGGWAQLLADRGYATLQPNPRGSSGKGDPFQTLNLSDWGGADMGDILLGVDWCIAQGVADGERTGIGGWSYGGFMTAWTESQTTRFKAAIVGAGLCNLISFNGTTDITEWHEKHFEKPIWKDAGRYWNHSALKYAAQVTTPTLILHGEQDERVPFSQGQEWAKVLSRRGIPVEFVAYPREPHAIEERAHQHDVLTRVLAWYDKYLKG